MRRNRAIRQVRGGRLDVLLAGEGDAHGGFSSSLRVIGRSRWQRHRSTFKSGASGVVASTGRATPAGRAASARSAAAVSGVPVGLLATRDDAQLRIGQAGRCSAPWPPTRARGATRRIPRGSSGAPASPSDARGRRSRSHSSSGSRTAHARPRPAPAFGPRVPCQIVHRPAKAQSGRPSSRGEPGRRLARLGVGPFAERRQRPPGRGSRARASAANAGSRGIADVGDRRAAELRWPRHPPAHHLEPAAGVGEAHDGRHLVGKRCRAAAADCRSNPHGSRRSCRSIASCERRERVEVAHGRWDNTLKIAARRRRASCRPRLPKK